MREPRSTYRLQLGNDLGFARVRELVDYLDRLGISDLYLSPMWQARAASTHLYDVVDPTTLDPRLGPRADLEALADDLRRRDMGIICDVVPNHMAASAENPWWWDVLSNGASSRYAPVFDIDWDRGSGRVVLPVLGGELEDVLDEMRIERVGEETVLRYHEHAFPLRATDETEPTTDLLDRQPYRLGFWRTGERDINYRRFFDITDLVATRMDTPQLIDDTHALVFDLARNNTVTGLRIDHVDGLRDPGTYLAHLAGRLPEDTYVVVEKILARDETLPSGWACAGTTGYEFADVTEAAFVDARGAAALRLNASRVTNEPQRFEAIARDAKQEALETTFTSELDALVSALEEESDFDPQRLRAAVVDATVALGVYRTYVTGPPVAPVDKRRIALACAAVRDGDCAAYLRRAFATAPDSEAVASWQQLCVPVTAKGVEDTAMYRYAPLVSRNEVGAEPGEPAVGVDAFHAFHGQRQRRWPLSMNASSTHDSKRGEDVRARIDVLSEIPDRWTQYVDRWMRWNTAHKTDAAPDALDELLLYQTLIGTWPVHRSQRPRFNPRIRSYMLKAAREAKRKTSWRDPDPRYEAALDRFVRRVLAASNARFVADIERFVSDVALHGAVNSLARLLVKVAAPGVPDFYQGAELWHLRLVDPDNREPVDFDARARMLERIESRAAKDLGSLASDLLERWTDGAVKLFVTWRALAVRRRWPEVFAHGAYVELATDARTLAFARRRGRRWVIVCVPRFSTRTVFGSFALGSAWGRRTIRLPDVAPRRYENVLTGEVVEANRRSLAAADAFRRFPVALLVATKTA